MLRVAPLSVAGLLRGRLFEHTTAVLTSATLTIGGTFDAMASAWGLAGDDDDVKWRGIDVGSPFEHAKSGILYVAAHLPPPGRDGTGSAEQLDEIAALITAAGGRTLGLFSSMRAAKAAAEIMRERLDTPVLCQGEDTTSALVQRFADDAETSLFGTLSLWQGVDVPGPSLSLVLIDRIPFPRPDDPLLTARQRAVAARGGNGFMAVAASHAALLLAQGAGRLLRRVDDRGVVAVLDSRMATARYGGYLRASLPPFWATTDSSPGARSARTAARRLTAFTILAANSLSPKGGVHEPTTPGGRRDRGLLGAAGHRLHHDAAGQGGLGVRRPVPRRRDARHRRTDRPAARRARRRPRRGGHRQRRDRRTGRQRGQRHRGVLGPGATARRSTASSPRWRR